MNSEDPKITVGTQVYSKGQKDYLKECVDSLIDQTYDDYEILVVSEHDGLKEFVDSNYDDGVRCVFFDNDEGLSAARNRLYNDAKGDIVAYIDSDAEAHPKWVERIVEGYEDDDVISVGGRSVADWKYARPPYLPDEFLWLVGVTHEGHPEGGQEIRSTFGCNMSFKRSVLEDLDGFSEDMGKDHGYNLQGEEQEVSLRMRDEFGRGMFYKEDAIIYHKVDKYQSEFRWLSKRAYLQGVTKAFIESRSSDDEDVLSTEKEYSSYLISSLLSHFRNLLITSGRINTFFKILGMVYFTFLVGLGYLVGNIKP